MNHLRCVILNVMFVNIGFVTLMTSNKGELLFDD